MSRAIGDDIIAIAACGQSSGRTGHMTVFDWFGDTANSDAIKAICALIGIPSSAWGGYLLYKKLRGAGLDDRVNVVDEKADRLLLENRLLRLQMVQDRVLLEKVLLKLEPRSLTPGLIENIKEVAKSSAIQNELEERRLENYAAQLREKSLPKVSVPTAPLKSPDRLESHEPLAELARLIGQTDPFAKLDHVRSPNDLEEDIAKLTKIIARDKYDPVAKLARLIGQQRPSDRRSD
jgi:hypothetical protein